MSQFNSTCDLRAHCVRHADMGVTPNADRHNGPGMALSQCAERIGRAMGLEHVKERSVRKYYAARIRENGQLVMKGDDWNAGRPFMEVAAANRRNQILDQCWHDGKKKIDGSRATPSNKPQTLKELGVTKSQSSRWQRLALKNSTLSPKCS